MDMQNENQIDINHGQQLLANGPLFIGEVHTQLDAEARRYLIALMRAGHVTRLFLEIPVCSSVLSAQLADPTIPLNQYKSKLSDIFNFLMYDNPNVSWMTLIEIAHSCGVPVYFHDLSVEIDALDMRRTIPPQDIANFGLLTTYAVDPYNYMDQLVANTNFYTAQQHKKKPTYTQRFNDPDGVGIRNQYSAQVIQHHCTDPNTQILNLQGVVIFAGGAHYEAENCNGQPLQQLLNLNNNLVIDFNRSEENVTNRQTTYGYSYMLERMGSDGTPQVNTELEGDEPLASEKTVDISQLQNDESTPEEDDRNTFSP